MKVLKAWMGWSSACENIFQIDTIKPFQCTTVNHSRSQQVVHRYEHEHEHQYEDDHDHSNTNCTKKKQ